MKKLLLRIGLALAVLLGLVVGLFVWSMARDQWNFSQAANQCERDCIQDSGGLASCREACKDGRSYGPPH